VKKVSGNEVNDWNAPRNNLRYITWRVGYILDGGNGRHNEGFDADLDILELGCLGM
jgi:hypothetical protein